MNIVGAQISARFFKETIARYPKGYKNLYEVNRAPTLCEFLTQDTSQANTKKFGGVIHMTKSSPAIRLRPGFKKKL
jgi:hypothetical protein